ncbi:hypothetical protein [Segatella bryantii]|uniref:hypothetical protein n=1 Tax=Segatella bryantii TaxID=77095 RepID=UPI00242DBF5B|nr:hypothetical protein [Segatella bryantii]
MLQEGLMEFRVQNIILHKHVKDGEDIEHYACINTDLVDTDCKTLANEHAETN